jgi:dUTP pyrophosphatase
MPGEIEERRDQYGRLLVSEPVDLTKHIRLKRLHPAAEYPLLSSPGAAGFDIAACLMSETGRPSKRLVSSQQTVSIPTGWAIRPPDGFCTLVLSRSGMAASNPPLFVANSPGLIDPNYTGEIQILLFNGGFNAAYVEHGQRIAQLIFIRREEFPFTEVEDLPPTSRGTHGFGSTGR